MSSKPFTHIAVFAPRLHGLYWWRNDEAEQRYRAQLAHQAQLRLRAQLNNGKPLLRLIRGGIG